MENKIDFEIPAEVVVEATGHSTAIATLIRPYVLGLSKEERKKLAKMGDGSLPFVQKAVDYSKSNPEFAPAYFDPERFANALTVYTQLSSIFRPITLIFSDLEDTMTEAGSECYSMALTYYNSVKQAAKDGVSGAKPIYEDLKKRFAHNGPGAVDNIPGES